MAKKNTCIHICIYISIQNLSEYKIRKRGKKKRNVNKQVRIIRALCENTRENGSHICCYKQWHDIKVYD